MLVHADVVHADVVSSSDMLMLYMAERLSIIEYFMKPHDVSMNSYQTQPFVA